MLNIKPKKGYVLARVEVNTETKTPGGLFIPESAEVSTNRARVISGGRFEGTNLDGKIVLFDITTVNFAISAEGKTKNIAWQAAMVSGDKLENGDYLLIKEGDIHGWVEESEVEAATNV